MAVGMGANRKLGYADYDLIPYDGKQHEIIDGNHLVHPSPGIVHQLVLGNLLYQLYSQIKVPHLGTIWQLLTALQLSDHDIVQPDLFIVLEAKKSLILPMKVEGIPDLIVEIISPSTPDLDRVQKKELYERSGVPEYWIVDPFEHTLDQFVLHEGKFELQPATTIVRPSIVNDVAVPMDQVW